MGLNMQYGWGGFQPWFVILIGFVLLCIAFMYLQRRDKEKKRKEQQDTILCTFYGQNGKRKHHWCNVVQGIVELSPEEKKRVEKIEKDLGYKGDPKKLGAVESPVGIEPNRYFTNTEFIFSDMWPPDKPPSQQRQIKTCEFMEGIPLPIIGINLAKWNAEMIEKYASSLIGLAADADTMKALNAQDHSFWNNLSKAVQMLGQLNMIKIACIGAAAGGLISAGIGYMVLTKMNQLFSLFVPSG